MINKKFFGVGGISQVGEPPITYPVSFSSTSTTFNPYYSVVHGVCFHPTDGYLYTSEVDNSTGNYYFVKRNATTGAYISTSSSYGTVQQYGLAITSDGSFWVIDRSSSSKLRKYNSSGVYQNFEFNATGYYADDVVCDDNDIFYVIRAASSTIYTYNTSGVSQGNFSLGYPNAPALMHASGSLHRATTGTEVSVRDIAGATNVSSWYMPSSNNFRRASDYDSTLGFAWINALSYVEKFTPNF